MNLLVRSSKIAETGIAVWRNLLPVWLTFLIDDVPGTVARLKEKGVECITAPVEPPDAKSIVCLEAPDGIMIEFVQVE